MKKTLYLLGIMTLFSCSYQPSQQVILEKEETNIQAQSKFNNEPLTVTISKVFTSPIPKADLKNYNFKLQKHLENDYDGKSFSFQNSNNSFKVNFTLNQSFKITDNNLYCREYSQHIEYMNEVIDHTGVACRQKPNLWENLVLLTE